MMKASLVIQCALVLLIISTMAPGALAEAGKETTVHSNGKDHKADFAYTRKAQPQNVFLDNAQQCQHYNEGCFKRSCCSGCECLRVLFKCVGKC